MGSSLVSGFHGDFERLGGQSEAMDGISPDINIVLETDVELLKDVGQGEEYQGSAKLLSQTSPLPDLSI